MGSWSRGIVLVRRIVKAASILSAIALIGTAFAEEEKKPSPCTEDAIIVFDASGSMSGNQTLGIPNSRARIDEARAQLDGAQQVLLAIRFASAGQLDERQVEVRFRQAVVDQQRLSIVGLGVVRPAERGLGHAAIH